MSNLLRRYADGTWLTPGLIRFASSIALAITLASLALLVATATGTVDILGRPLGADFTSFWSAGHLAAEGRAPASYDWTVLRDVQHALHGVDLFFPWSYPPVFLLIASGLARMPYLLALCVWQGSTLLAALAALRASVPARLALLAALGCPTVFACLVNGQTGFLSGALFMGGIVALPRRPVLAGILFGLLAYKPQLGLLIPLVLAAGGFWRAFLAATATVLALVGVTVGIWGWPVWDAFLASVGPTQAVVLESGGPGFAKFQSVFAWARLWGGTTETAYALQALTAATCAGFCAWIWHRPVGMRIKGAALMIGTLLATPYVLDYDMVVLGMAIALLFAHGQERGFRPWEKTAMALAWLAPAGARGLGEVIHLPIGVPILAALFGLIVSRVRAESRTGAVASADAAYA